MVQLAKQRLFWSFSLFFGWLLSFPVNGPILYQLAAARGFNGDQWGLLFSFSHAVGFLLIALSAGRWPIGPQAPLWSLTVCLLGTISAWFIPVHWGPYLMMVLGLTASIFVMGCCHGYTKLITDNKPGFMASVILAANIISYLVIIICGFVSLNFFLFIASVLLLASFRLPVQDAFPGAILPPNDLAPRFPVKFLIFVCLLILGLDINGGFMYQVIVPYFDPFQVINRYYSLIPYMAILAMIILTRWNKDKIFLVYIGSAMLGLGFVFFALLKISLAQYFLINTLILGGLALLDLFIWTILGEIAENHGHISQVFGFGLAANVLALAVGGLLGAKLRTDAGDYKVMVALLASATIFLTSVLFPGLVNRIKSDLLKKEAQKLVTENHPNPSLKTSRWNALISEDVLTAREEELLELILEGYTNEDIAKQLTISVNTVKVHVKSIIRKYGVATKNELLALIIKTYHQEIRLREQQKTGIH